jgi:hypothetical protein
MILGRTAMIAVITMIVTYVISGQLIPGVF